MSVPILRELIPLDDVPTAAGGGASNPGEDRTSFENKLAIYLRALERAGQEVVGVGLFDPNGQNRNMVESIETDAVVKKAPLEVFVIPDEAALRGKLATHTPVERGYATMLVGGIAQDVLVARKGRDLVWRGKMSTFGGPNDTGMREDEGLAIVNTQNFAAISQKHQTLFGAPLFLNTQNPGSTPLGRRLDPEAFYLACRWDYRNDIAPNHLIDCTIMVSNQVTGTTHEAIATDWGPHERTGRVADLSPGLAKALGLSTDDQCVATVTGSHVKPRTTLAAPGTLPPTGAPGNLSVFTQAELVQKFGEIIPVQEKGDGSFKIQNQNFNTNIVMADISPLSGIRGVPNNGRVECHSAIKVALEAAVRDVVAAGKKDRILTWDGLFVPRHILWDQSRGFSTHSWGIAFDINVNWNGYGSRPAPSGMKGSVEELVFIFANRGFTWGGYWRTPDGMHFQYGA